MELYNRIKEKLEHNENLRSNNPLLWAEIARDMCQEKNIDNIDDFLIKIISGEIPNSHSVTATLSVVRKENPHLRPNTEGRDRQLEIQRQYIDNWNNAL